MEIKDVTRCSFFAPDPKLMTVDFTQLEKTQKERREERDAANPPKPEGVANELSRLRGELFKLEQHAKHTEVYTNEQAGRVKLLESNLAHALKQKKVAAEAGNLLAERNSEHAINRLERELVDVEKEFQRARRVSAGAAIQLKEWPHHERIEELAKLVG